MNADVKTKFESYPKEVAERLLRIRCIIFRTAEQAEISDLQETLKWGQPSYLSKIGSTIRYDWSPNRHVLPCWPIEHRLTSLNSYSPTFSEKPEKGQNLGQNRISSRIDTSKVYMVLFLYCL
jgi:hypothetical protein